MKINSDQSRKKLDQPVSMRAYEHERGDDGRVEDGQVGGDVVGQRHLGHVAHVLHQVLSSVGVRGGGHGEKAEQDAGPGGVVGGQHVVDVNSALGKKENPNILNIKYSLRH